MLKLLLAPKYLSLKSFIEEIPTIFEKSGKVIYTGRNLIKTFEIGDLVVNVKRYAVPIFINKLAYSFFRIPKGLRAYRYPQILLEKGVSTPEPIAYIEERKFGLIHYSYFISVQSDYSSFLYKIGDCEVDEIRELTKALALFTSDMHKKGIYHKDYSPGNILCGKKNGLYDFTLVDINRMKFGEVSLDEGCANFARLWGQPSFFKYLAEVYAKDQGADIEYCVERVMYHREKFWKAFSKRKKIEYKLNY